LIYKDKYVINKPTRRERISHPKERKFIKYFVLFFLLLILKPFSDMIIGFTVTVNEAPASGGGGGGNSGGGSGGGGGGGGGGGVLSGSLAFGFQQGLQGDLNGDGHVDVIDFNTLMTQWGKTGSNLTEDINHDGIVDIFDFNILVANWKI
jgi:hypothetical protein